MRYEASHVISAPLPVVFAFVSDARNETLWLADPEPDIVVATEHHSGPETGLGAVYKRTNRFGSKTFEVFVKVVGFERDRSVEFASADGASTISTDGTSTVFTVAPVGEDTRLTCIRVYEKGWPRFATGLVAVYMRPTILRDLRRIERVIGCST